MTLLEGKVAFITGVARGQGRAHAVRLAEEGADIIGVDVCADYGTVSYPMATKDDLEETAELVRQTGRRALLRQADVRSSTELNAVVAAGVAEFGHVDIAVANAGIGGGAASRRTSWLYADDGKNSPTLADGDVLTEEEMEANWNDIIAVNLTGVWNTVRAVARLMIDRGEGGSIILTSSAAGLRGLTAPGAFGNEAYGAAKHGVVGLMRQFAIELSKWNIRVNSIHPCGVETPMIRNPEMQKFFSQFPDPAGDLSNLLPVSVLEPRDVSEVVLFLASDPGRYLTGVALPVDAGFTAR